MQARAVDAVIPGITFNQSFLLAESCHFRLYHLPSGYGKALKQTRVFPRRTKPYKLHDQDLNGAYSENSPQGNERKLTAFVGVYHVANTMNFLLVIAPKEKICEELRELMVNNRRKFPFVVRKFAATSPFFYGRTD